MREIQKVEEKEYRDAIIDIYNDRLKKDDYIYITKEEVDVNKILYKKLKELGLEKKENFKKPIYDWNKKIDYLFKLGINKDDKKKLKNIIIIQAYLNQEKIYNTAFRKRQIRILDILKGKDNLKRIGQNYLYDENKVETIKINSVAGLLSQLKNKNIAVKDNKTIFFSRGQANFSWELMPSIYRKEKWINNESVMYQDIQINNPEEFEDKINTFEKLTKMQHYNFPTRLIDITTNMLVSLYFACKDKNNESESGRIFSFKPKIDNVIFSDSEEVSIIANLALLSDTFNSDIKQFDTEMLSKIVKAERPYFDRKIGENEIKRNVFVKTKHNNQRIKRQSGAFILCGMGNKKVDYCKEFDCQEINNKKLNILVPYDKKDNILEELEFLGINEGI